MYDGCRYIVLVSKDLKIQLGFGAHVSFKTASHPLLNVIHVTKLPYNPKMKLLTIFFIFLGKWCGVSDS